MDKSQKIKKEGLRPLHYTLLSISLLLCLLLGICVGSVSLSPGEVFAVLRDAVAGTSTGKTVAESVLLWVRIPRVLCVALVGAALSLCGSAMQGLLRNPLADGSTLGVSSAASLGAALAIALNIQLPFLPIGGSMVMAILFAFGALLCILSLAYKLDASLSTNTIILLGVILSMFCSSLINLVIAFAGDKVRSIVFWTMGSLADSSYLNAGILFTALVVCGGLLLLFTRELNAFAISEDNARHVGVPVRRVKLLVLILCSVLIGICVSIGGSIGFVGLIIPHITRMITGPNHKRLLPASLFFGACFLLLADLLCRTLLNPKELPIGVVTSIIGAFVFVFIFYSTRKGR